MSGPTHSEINTSLLYSRSCAVSKSQSNLLGFHSGLRIGHPPRWSRSLMSGRSIRRSKISSAHCFRVKGLARNRYIRRLPTVIHAALKQMLHLHRGIIGVRFTRHGILQQLSQYRIQRFSEHLKGVVAGFVLRNGIMSRPVAASVLIEIHTGIRALIHISEHYLSYIRG